MELKLPEETQNFWFNNVPTKQPECHYEAVRAWGFVPTAAAKGCKDFFLREHNFQAAGHSSQLLEIKAIDTRPPIPDSEMRDW